MENPVTEQSPQGSEPVSSTSAGGKDLLGVRIAAALIDFAVFLVLFVVLAMLIGEASLTGGSFSFFLDGAGAALFIALVLLYYFVLEATIGQTVGKLLLNVRVACSDGSRPPVSAVAIRTVLRVVDSLPAFYLVGFITMMATGTRRQRLGDLAAKTSIVLTPPMRHRGLAAAAVASALVLILTGAFVYVAASAEEEKTYHAHGVSFDYPAEWEEVLSVNAASDKLWSTEVGVGDENLVIVNAYQLNVPVTAENLDEAKAEFTPLLQQNFEQLDGTIHAGPEEITMAGKPGLRYKATGAVDGTPIESTIVLAFDGTVEYFLNCQYTQEMSADIKQGCDQIMRTFKLDQQGT
jgi:uncharacterized RDD family membrane protein YckC